MSSTLVTLSLLEDLTHWPLPSHEAAADANGRPSPDPWATTPSTIDKDAPEPHARRLTRCRAVLHLPWLCRKLGPKWCSAELVPYLMRCLEEEDPQLHFVVGLALMGLVMPRHHVDDSGTRSGSSSSTSATTSDISLEAAMPVFEALCACREPRIRQFVAEVVWPHACLGMSVERAVTSGSWEEKYLPASVWFQGEGGYKDEEAEAQEGEPVDAPVATQLGKDALLEGDDSYDAAEELSFLFNADWASLSRTGGQQQQQQQQGHHANKNRRGSDTLLRDAPFALFGAKYATQPRDTDATDVFSLNVHARLLLSDIETWMDAFTPSAPPSASPATANSSRDAAPFSTQRTKHIVYASDYFRDDCPRRDALRARWKISMRILENLLNSSNSGAVAVATSIIAGLIHAFHDTMGSISAYAHPAAAVNSGGSLGPIVVRQPLSPITTPAELQQFHYHSTRRHIAFTVAAAASRRRMPTTETELTRLFSQSLVAVQTSLVELLQRSGILIPALDLDASLSSPAKASVVAPGMLQFGPGPHNARLNFISTWDVCFSSTARDGPVDVDYLITPADDSAPHASNPSAALAAPPRFGVNAASSLKLHRMVRMATLTALPLMFDSSAMFGSKFATEGTTTAADSKAVTLDAVCQLLVQMMVPPSLMLDLLERYGADDKDGDANGAKTSGSKMSVNSSGDALDNFSSPVTPFFPKMFSSHKSEESPASLDFGLLESTLEAVHRTFAEVAAQAPRQVAALYAKAAAADGKRVSARSPSFSEVDTLATQHIASMLRRLFLVYQACVWCVPVYASWKARWLLAQKLPAITASFVYVLIRLQHAAFTSCGSNSPGFVSHILRYYHRVCKVQAKAWTPGDSAVVLAAASPNSFHAALRASPLSGWVDDEETEVRCIAPTCASGVIALLCDAAQRLARLDQKGADDNVMNALADSLLSVSDAAICCIQSALTDSTPRVRCGAAMALSELCRAFSGVLGVLSPVGTAQATWLAHFTAVTESFLSLMMDKSSLVQLTLVDGFADLLISTSFSDRDELTPAGKDKAAAQVWQSVLLASLENLSKHEMWRYRVRYATLLCEMIFKFMTPRQSGASSLTESAAWAHTHPLYRLARQELLPLLVNALFDKVRAVRDAALAATKSLCSRLACHHQRSKGLASGDDADTDGSYFVNDVIWPLVKASPIATDTYLARSSLLRLAVGLRVDKSLILLPLLDELAHDPVLNVRLVVAKVTLEILLESSSATAAHSTSISSSNNTAAREDATTDDASASTTLLPAGTVAYRILMGKPLPRNGEKIADMDGERGNPALQPSLSPPLTFTPEERNGVVLHLLRKLLADPVADVREEAAKAIQLCF